jgi:hypothetical protein
LISGTSEVLGIARPNWQFRRDPEPRDEPMGVVPGGLHGRNALRQVGLRQIAAAPGCLSAMVIVAVGGSGGHHSQGVQSGVLDEDRHEFSARVRGETSETGQR